MNNTKNKNIIFYERSLYMHSKYQPLLVGSFLIFALLIPNVSLSNASNSLPTINYDDSSETVQALKNFALSKINEDRAKHGLFPLLQSNNSAAQIHANELLQTKTISHMTTDGFKPYMLYSLYNGTGYVQQNVGQISYVLSNDGQNYHKASDLCFDFKRFYCPVIDQYKAIDDLEYSMMNNDEACCNNGHKNNILNKFHTHVSIGIAFNEYYFVMVQNFENHYLNSDLKILKNNEDIILEAEINDQNKFNFVINHVSFFLDEVPTKLNYEKNRDKNSYDFGDLKLMISKPLPSDLEYIQEKKDDSYNIIEAKKWDLNKNNIDLEFQLPDTLNTKNKILTMVVYAQTLDDNPDENHLDPEYVPITSYTFFNY
ncbi:MAG: CAP domain-containing protein [Candidatus Nitrosocosmicus sp.]|nr:CAP domain-containing protein [Candidatus Nitrosocosmicus sp.]